MLKITSAAFSAFFFSMLASSDLSAAMPSVDMKGVVSHQDVLYLAPARHGWEGMPLGNGTLGAQVWQPDALQFQLNTPLAGVYNGGICQIRLRSSHAFLTGLKSYRQRLSLYDATLTTELESDSGAVSIVCFIPADADALVIRVTDRRVIKDAEFFLDLISWRPTAACSAADGRIKFADLLKVQNQPDYRFAVEAAVEGDAAEAAMDGRNSASIRIPAREFTALISFAGTRDAQSDPASAAAERLAALKAKGWDALRSSHSAWWAAFWDKSFIRLAGPDGTADYLANLCYMHLYAMASGSRGEVPPKFNGGLWLWEKDEREWGPCYWHWNTQETYWPLYAANHLELIRPYYDLYWNMLPEVKKWTKACWEIDGAQFQETIPFTGAMGIWERERGIHPRVPVPKNVAHTNLIFSSSAEIAMQFWWYWLYTGDKEFLKDRAYPLMKEAAIFYAAYLEKGPDGKYHSWPSNAHESFWKVKNPATDLAAMRFIFPAATEAARILGVDDDLRAVWQERLDNLASYPINPANGAILPYQLKDGEKMEWRNAENPELFPFGVFPLMRLDTPDFDLARKTFQARKNVNAYGWTTDSIAAARLGMAQAQAKDVPPQLLGVEELLPLHAEYYQVYPCGLQDYYTRKPGKHFYLEGSGTFSTGVGEMLLQPWDVVIRICPALPAAWDADFKLLAMGGFEVLCHAEKGRAKAVWIKSLRGSPAAVVNPFGCETVVEADGKAVLSSAERLLKFPTEAGKTYELRPVGSGFAAATITAEPNREPKRLAPASRRWLGRNTLLASGWKPPAEPDAPAPPQLPVSIKRPANPEVSVPRLASAPKIDGELKDEAWKDVAPIGPFFVLGKADPAKEQTDVRIGCDDSSLYFAITCWESRMDGLQAEFEPLPDNRDADVFFDDSVEIFLQPQKGGAIWHFAVNPLGARYDSRGTTAATDDRRLSPPWTSAAMRYANRWTVEAAIPFDSVSPFPPNKGERWSFNVGRNNKGHGETSTFAPFGSSAFFLPAEFAVLLFSGGADKPQQLSQKLAEQGLVGYWDCDELKGIWLPDRSGNRHFALANGQLKIADGKIGRAVEFPGGGFLDVASAPDLNLGDQMTLAVWVKPGQKGAMRLIDKGPAGGADAYLLDTHPENHVRVITRIGTLNTPKPVLPVDEWSHVAAVLGGGTLTVYINGEAAASLPCKGSLTPTELPLRFGADSTGANIFRGLMDEIRIYNRALSEGEIRRLAGKEEGR